MIDLFARRIVGYALSDSMQDTLPLEALQRALRLRCPEPGLIHHTDRGCQYAALAYRHQLQAHGIVQSMSRKADCFDNAVAESAFATIEKDVILRHQFATKDIARRVLIDYLENFYNPI